MSTQLQRPGVDGDRRAQTIGLEQIHDLAEFGRHDDLVSLDVPVEERDSLIDVGSIPPIAILLTQYLVVEPFEDRHHDTFLSFLRRGNSRTR